MEPLLSESELNEIEARVAAASAGPWKSFVEGRDHMAGSHFIRTGREDIELSGATIADQDFIAAARQDVPRLIAHIRALQKRLGMQMP